MKKQISLLVASAMLLSSSAAMASQSDEAIKSMQNAGIVIGNENGDLQLDSPVTRAEFSKLIYEVLESENSSILNFDDTSLEFSDINSDFWAYNYIMPLKNANIINGYENQTFMPNENILFKEAAKIAAVSAGIISTNKNYPLDYIAAAIDNGLMDGVQALSEQAISRSDAINIAYNIKNFLNLKTEISNAEKAKQDETNNNNYNYTPQQSVTGSTSGGSGNGSGGGGSAINSSNSTSSVPWYPSFDTEEYTKEDENIFKINKQDTREKVKQNAYIDTVEIKRTLPDVVTIVVTERTATYQISFSNMYMLINNQGYMLETTELDKSMPLIVGVTTKKEEIKPGNRLCSDDLEKLEDVLRILESAKSNNLDKLINKIDITNKDDYVVEMKKEKKIVHLGDVTNLALKMLYVSDIINKEKDEGEIFVNTDLENKGAIFRKKV